MIKARTKYPTDLYGTIYIDNIQKAVVICLIIPTTFPFDAGSRVDNVRHTSRFFLMLDPGWTTYVIYPCIVFYAGSRVENIRHTSGYFFMLDPASKGNIVGMIRQMTTAF
jgi:hypothetical protein